MKSRHKHRQDHLTEILRAYKLPTIITFVGLIAAVLGFQLSLNYNLKEFTQDFRSKAQDTVGTVEDRLSQRKQMMSYLAETLANTEVLGESDFEKISKTFVERTSFINFLVLKSNNDTNSNSAPSLTDFFSNAPIEEKIKSAIIIEALKQAITNAADAKEKPYITPAFESDNGVELMAFVAPINKNNEQFFLIGIFDLSTFFSNILLKHEIQNVKAYDIETEKQRRSFFENISAKNEEFLSLPLAETQNLYSYEGRISFENHAWQIIFFSPADYKTYRIGIMPWVVFIMALSITALISYIIFRITTENLHIRNVVDQQTQSLKNYARRLEISNRDLEDFAHVASHDLKEPLRGIYNYAEFLIEDYHDKLDKEGQNKLLTLKKLARRMEAFVDSLLEYSKLTSIDFTVRKTDMNKVIENVLEIQDIWLKENKASIKAQENLPVTKCDPVRVAEIFRNLITNGVKYNDSREKIIEIGCCQNFDEWPDIDIFFVKDNGIGIAENNKPQVFRIFKRLHAREAYGGGTGAGLTLVWKIVKRHNGHIWFESELDKGTTFFFTLEGAQKNDRE